MFHGAGPPFGTCQHAPLPLADWNPSPAGDRKSRGHNYHAERDRAHLRLASVRPTTFRRFRSLSSHPAATWHYADGLYRGGAESKDPQDRIIGPTTVRTSSAVAPRGRSKVEAAVVRGALPWTVGNSASWSPRLDG